MTSGLSAPVKRKSTPKIIVRACWLPTASARQIFDRAAPKTSPSARRMDAKSVSGEPPRSATAGPRSATVCGKFADLCLLCIVAVTRAASSSASSS